MRCYLQEEIILTGQPLPEVANKLTGTPSAHGIEFAAYPIDDPDDVEPFPTVPEDGAEDNGELPYEVVAELSDEDATASIALPQAVSNPLYAHNQDAIAAMSKRAPASSGMEGARNTHDHGSRSWVRRVASSVSRHGAPAAAQDILDGEQPPSALALPHLSLQSQRTVGSQRTLQHDGAASKAAARRAALPKAVTRGRASLARNVSVRVPVDRNGRMRYHAGRPNMNAMFTEVEAEAVQHGEERVAVLVCGNQQVLRSVMHIARERSAGGSVAFDVHYEAFGF